MKKSQIIMRLNDIYSLCYWLKIEKTRSFEIHYTAEIHNKQQPQRKHTYE